MNIRPLLIAMLLTTLGFAGLARAADEAKKKIVFVAGGPSHGFFAHDHLAGCKLLAARINALPGYEATVHYKDWPEAKAFDGALAIVIYCDGGKAHMAVPHKDELVALSKKGVGIGFIHFAVEVEKTEAANEWLDMIGGYFETFFSVNPHWTAQFNELTKHPVTNGVKPFQQLDEWYYHMRFRENLKDVRPILSAVPPDSSRVDVEDAHKGNATVHGGIGKNLLEHVMWVSENFGGDGKEPVSRGFGCTGGHFHKNWAQDDFRKTVLNAIVWIAHGEVPKEGIESKRPDVEELLANRDPGMPKERVPNDFDKAGLAKEIEEMNKPYEPKVMKPASASAAKPGQELLKTY